MPRHSLTAAILTLALSACTVAYQRVDSTSELPEANVKPGITVLLSDSISLIRGKRIGLLTNRTGVDENGRSDIELLRTDRRATSANVHLVALFSPEHGLAGTADHPNLPNSVEPRSGLPVYSLYTTTTIAPPDSVLGALDAIVVDLQDVGTRTWTYVGAMVYTMRSAARLHKPVIVLDRPNPLTGAVVEGPVLDSTLASPAIAFALYPIPLRHGMTMAELARFYNDVLDIKADLRVVPAAGWRRDVWFDRTGLPFVPPSPNLPSFKSVMIYPALVAFEGTNLSVGRGTPDAFQLIGAPWLNAEATVKLLKSHGVRGVRFTAEDFTPVAPPDGKYAGQRVHGIRITVVDRTAMQVSRVCADLLWAINRTSGAGLRVNARSFDLRFGSPSARIALLRGDDPDAVIDQAYVAAYAFRERSRRYFLY